MQKLNGIIAGITIKGLTSPARLELGEPRDVSLRILFAQSIVMTQHLTCEIKTLCYPRAAVFAFCLALMAWNGMLVIHAALRSVHGEETVQENLSGYYLSLEISQVYHGMMIAIPAEEWAVFQNLTTAQLALLSDFPRLSSILRTTSSRG